MSTSDGGCFGGATQPASTMPASGGAQAPPAHEDRSLAGCARVSCSVAKVRERRHELRETRIRRQRVARPGARFATDRKACRGETTPTIVDAAAKPDRRSRPEPDARKSVSGRRFLRDGRYLGRSHRVHRFTRALGGRLGSFSDGRRANAERRVRATGVPEARARLRARSAEASRSVVKQAAPASRGVSSRRGGTSEARVLVQT